MPQYDWLEEVQKGTSELESPKQYYYWAALAALSAVCKRNVYLNRFAHFLYPNIYVFLIGKSGIRKSGPVTLATRLVSGVRNTRVITGRASIQGITKLLGTNYTQEGGQIIDTACGFIAAGEFASSLVADPQALSILTDLYDGHAHDTWRNTLVGREGETLERPYVTGLFAANIASLAEMIQDKDVLGGFIGRTFVINATKRNAKNSLIKAPEQMINEKELVEYLKEVAKLNNEFTWGPGAAEFFDNWYMQQDDNKEDPTGTYARLDTAVLKVGMLISLSKRLDCILTLDDIQESLIACSNLVSDMNQVFMPDKGAKTEIGKKITMVLNDLMNAENNTVTRQTLMTRHWGYLDAYSLDLVIETLVQPGVIKVRKDGSKASHTFYVLTKEGHDAIIQMENRVRDSIAKGEPV